MSVRLLAVGDIHLGRRPSRLPEALVERVDPAELGPAAAWRRAVAAARAERVHAVLLAGDVVEQNDDFYEAYGDLDAGVRELAAAGIAVLGVAGNHDDRVLPRLADAIDSFRLLGRGGRWECTRLAGAGGVEAQVLGWSFPTAEVTVSPLGMPLPPLDPDLATIGLLHCDRDQSSSRYAPVRSAELDAAPVDAWLLGHVHRPDRLAGDRPCGYLGSLTSLDPGEAGARGPWLVEVAGRHALRATHLPIAPLRWQQVTVALDGLESPADVHGAIAAALDALHERLAEGGGSPRAVGCRLVLTGRTPQRPAIERALAADDPRDLLQARDGVLYFVDGWRNEALPALDLEQMAGGHDPAALLARRVLALRRGAGDAECRTLLEAARARLDAVERSPVFAALTRAPADDAATLRLLEAAALRALDALLEQREGAG